MVLTVLPDDDSSKLRAAAGRPCSRYRAELMANFHTALTICWTSGPRRGFKSSARTPSRH